MWTNGMPPLDLAASLLLTFRIFGGAPLGSPSFQEQSGNALCARVGTSLVVILFRPCNICIYMPSLHCHIHCRACFFDTPIQHRHWYVLTGAGVPTSTCLSPTTPSSLLVICLLTSTFSSTLPAFGRILVLPAILDSAFVAFAISTTLRRQARPVVSCRLPDQLASISGTGPPFSRSAFIFVAALAGIRCSSVRRFLPNHLAQPVQVRTSHFQEMEIRQRPQQARLLIRRVAQRFRNTPSHQGLYGYLKRSLRNSSEKENNREVEKHATMAEQEEDYSVLPLQDRFAHKVRPSLRARRHGMIMPTLINDRSGKPENLATKTPRSSSLYHPTNPIPFSARS